MRCTGQRRAFNMPYANEKILHTPTVASSIVTSATHHAQAGIDCDHTAKSGGAPGGGAAGGQTTSCAEGGRDEGTVGDGGNGRGGGGGDGSGTMSCEADANLVESSR